MDVDCPVCGKEIDVSDRLPSSACDTNLIECECGAELDIGWYAIAEVRDFRTEHNVK